MHWPPADRPADSSSSPLDAAGEARFAAGPGSETPSPGDHDPGPSYVTPFTAFDAEAESPWANRLIWSAAAAAVVCGGVWFAGVWEVRLDDPPAGALADLPGDESLGEALGDEWPEDEWGSEADADLDSLWGEEPTRPDGPDGAGGAFDLMADASASDSTSASLDEVQFTPPESPAAAGAVAAADLWSEPEPATVPALPERTRPTDEPAGGLYASTARPTPIAPVTGTSTMRPTAPPRRTASAESAVPATPAAPAADAPLGAGFDPFADLENDAAPTSVETSAAVENPYGGGVTDGGVTPASMSASTANASAVTTADENAPAAQPAPGAASPATNEEYLAAIDAALDAGEVLQAHTELSRLWWDRPADRSEIRRRLDGTARQIYFDKNSHFMTPRTVTMGETLADVAADLSVPEMYLARVNRVAPKAVAPGDELKVIRGPFGGAIDLSGAGADSLTMHAHGYYVRAFTAHVGEVKAGEYRVAGKVKNARGVQILLLGGDGDRLFLVGGPLPEGRPAVALRPTDADQVFDLLETGGAVSVRP